jgi:hypothetical protein
METLGWDGVRIIWKKGASHLSICVWTAGLVSYQYQNPVVVVDLVQNRHRHHTTYVYPP